ncbi:MAG: hypothetical protein WA947_04730 [Phormidesmis sp.]
MGVEESRTKNKATPACQKLGWLWHHGHNRRNWSDQFGGELSVLVPANADSD